MFISCGVLLDLAWLFLMLRMLRVFFVPILTCPQTNYPPAIADGRASTFGVIFNVVTSHLHNRLDVAAVNCSQLLQLRDKIVKPHKITPL